MMNRIGVGLYSLTGVYGLKNTGDVESMLRFALDEGVDFFDVARTYGTAEKVLGKIVKNHRLQVRIASKTGITQEGKNDCSYEGVIGACKKSLQELQTDYLDLFQIHYDDPYTPVEDTVGALEDLKTEGLILNYGLGHLPLSRVKEYGAKGRPSTIMLEISPVTMEYYWKYRDYCKEHDITMLAMGTAGRGLLTGHIDREQLDPGDIRRLDPLFQRGLYKSACRMRDILKDLGEILGRTPVQVALAWVLDLPGVKLALTGPSCKEHLKENLLGQELTLDREIRARLHRAIEEESRRKMESWHRDLAAIFSRPMVQESREVIRDLIFALEGLLVLDRITEQEAHQYFRQVMQGTEEKVKGQQAVFHELQTLYQEGA